METKKVATILNVLGGVVDLLETAAYGLTEVRAMLEEVPTYQTDAELLLERMEAIGKDLKTFKACLATLEEKEMTEFTRIQKLHLDLIREVAFNRCNGEAVARSLENHNTWWNAAIMTNAGGSLVGLRDLAKDGTWNVDTLYVIPASGRRLEIEELAKTWNADMVKWIGREEADKLLESGRYPTEDRAVLKVWWD